MAIEGKRVLLVDCDPQGNASSGLGLNRRRLKHCLYDLFMDQAEIRQGTKTKIDGLDVIPSTIQLAGAEVELALIDQRGAPPESDIEQDCS